MSDPITGVSPRRLARTAGGRYLLYRLGLAAHVVVTLTNIPMAVIIYDLLKVVNRRLALLDVFFILVATAVEVTSLPGQFTPLLLPSAPCWPSTPWPTWSTASPPRSRRGLPPIWFPGSGCPRSSVKDPSACGS